MANYPGYNPEAIGNPRIQTVTLTTPGRPRVGDASISLGIRLEKGSSKFTNDATTLYNKTPHPYRWKYAGLYPSAQSTNEFWLDLLKLSRNPIDAYLLDANGNWLNFFKDTGTDPLAPNGPGRVSLIGTKRTNSETERKIDVALGNMMTQACYEYLTSHNTAVAGGVGTLPDLALTSEAVDRAEIVPYGYYDVKFATHSIGLLNSVASTWEIAGTSDVQMGQNVAREQNHDIEIVTYQNDPNMFAATATHAITDGVTELYSRAGELETYNPGVIRPTFETMGWSDEYAIMKIMLKGTTVYDADFDSPAFMDFSTPASPVFSN